MFCFHPNKNLSNDLCMKCKTAICPLCRDHHLPFNKHKLLNYKLFLDKTPNNEESEILYFDKKLEDIQKFIKIHSRLLEKAEKDIILYAQENYLNLSRHLKEKEKFFDDKKDEINVAYNLTQFYNEDGTSILINDLEDIFKDIKAMCDINLINLLRKVANFKKKKIFIENIVLIEDEEINLKRQENHPNQKNNENKNKKRKNENEKDNGGIVVENENNRPKVGEIGWTGEQAEKILNENEKNKENFVSKLNTQYLSENKQSKDKNIINTGSGLEMESLLEKEDNKMKEIIPENNINFNMEEEEINSTIPIEKKNASNDIIICDREFDFGACKKVKKTGKKIINNKIEEEIAE